MKSISLPPDSSKTSSVAALIESTSLIYSPPDSSSAAVLTDITSPVYCQPDSSRIPTQKVIFEPSNACVSDSVIIMVIVLPLSVILLCGICVIGLLISIFMWKKKKYDEWVGYNYVHNYNNYYDWIHQYELVIVTTQWLPQLLVKLLFSKTASLHVVVRCILLHKFMIAWPMITFLFSVNYPQDLVIMQLRYYNNTNYYLIIIIVMYIIMYKLYI